MKQIPSNLLKKLHKIISEDLYVEKKGYNDRQNYSFAREADVLEAVRKKFTENNLLLLTTTLDSHKVEKLTTVTVEFTIVDLDSGESHTSMFEGQGMDGGDKGVYKAYTGAKKYFFLNTFMIATGDDPENTADFERKPAVEEVSNGRGSEEVKLSTARTFNKSRFTK